MAHGMIISDQDFLTDLLQVNLRGYLAAKSAVIKDLNFAKQLLAIDQTYDYIIALTSLANKDIVPSLLQMRSELSPNIPLLLLGHTPHALPNLSKKLMNLTNPYDVPMIIKLLVKALGITAEDFANKVWPDYFSIPLKHLEKMPQAFEDLYFESEHGDFIQVAHKGDALREKAPLWKSQKVFNLFVKSDKRVAAVSAITDKLLNELKISPDDVKISHLDIVNKVQEHVGIVLNDTDNFLNLSTETKKKIGELATEAGMLVERIQAKIPQSLNRLVELFQKSSEHFVNKHSLLVSFIAIEMVKNESWFSIQVAKKINLLLFFHDMPLLPLYHKYPDLSIREEEILSYPKLNDKEKQIARWHPKIVAQLVANLPELPMGLDQLILQHHGNIHGDLADTELAEDISLISKVVYVAEQAAIYLYDKKAPFDEVVRADMIKFLSVKLQKRSYIKLISHLANLQL